MPRHHGQGRRSISCGTAILKKSWIIVKEGTLESVQKGVVKRAGPGSIIFEASNELHGVRNIGTTPATYFVIKWYSPGTLNKQ